jgi:hypothetical protein
MLNLDGTGLVEAEPTKRLKPPGWHFVIRFMEGDADGYRSEEFVIPLGRRAICKELVDVVRQLQQLESKTGGWQSRNETARMAIPNYYKFFEHYDAPDDHYGDLIKVWPADPHANYEVDCQFDGCRVSVVDDEGHEYFLKIPA